MNRVAPDQRSWLGVAKHSPEFALISRRIIEVNTTDKGRGLRYLHCTAEYDFKAFHEFILHYGLVSNDGTAKLRDGS
jgi:hypothetical protein